MLTRRHLLMLAGATAIMTTLRPAAGFAQDSGAAAFIKENGNRILSLAPQAEGSAAVRQQLLTLVNQVLDVDGIARFALGPYARQATPAQLSRYQQLFRQVISNGVTARLSAYANASFAVGASDARDGGTVVRTVITRPGSPGANVDWLVGPIGGQTKILDVIAEGTSLRQTERSDYSSYLQSHGGNIDSLLTGIQGQITQ